jgi:single-stranded-DNA-specific exonuclease
MRMEPQTTTVRKADFDVSEEVSQRWVVAPPAPSSFLEAFDRLHTVIAQMCFDRDIRTEDDVNAFLSHDYDAGVHDPFLFRDMRACVDRILSARTAGERILVHGDYDADGISGSAILTETLTALGCAVEVFLPHRERDGYGFSSSGLDAARACGATVIITCDCGIANHDTIRAAGEENIDVIVTDHHLVPVGDDGAPDPPPAFAILHPGVDGETYPFPHLTGGGVAFKLCQALTKEDAASASPRLQKGFSKWLLDCVAISTVADFGKLVGENRTLVRYGIIVLEKTRRLGLRSLYDLAGISGKPITTRTIGFQIAPRINAAGRIADARAALDLLIGTDADSAARIAADLHATNVRRQDLVHEATSEALAQVTDAAQRFSIVVVGDGWPPGIVGLIATRVREKFNRPAIALTRTGGKVIGSGRSIPGFHIVDALRSVEEYLAAFGGHPQACGLTLKGSDVIPDFIQGLETYAGQHLSAEDFLPELRIDAALKLEDVNWDFVAALEQFGPFGEGHSLPRFLARGVHVDHVASMGRDGKHRRFHAHHQTAMPQKFVCFRAERLSFEPVAGSTVDIVFEVGVNEWRGDRTIQLNVVDCRSRESHSVPSS